MVERTVNASEEIDEGLSVGHAAAVLFRIDQLEVVGTHPHIHAYFVQVGEVDVARHVQRILVVGIHLEVFEQQVATHDAHRVVAEAHVDAVGDADHVAGIEEYLAVDFRTLQRTLDAQVAFTVAFETKELVGYETVDKRHGQALERKHHVDGIFPVGGVGARNGAHLLSFHRQCAVDEVRTVFQRHVHELRAEVAHGIALVGHLVDCHRR